MKSRRQVWKVLLSIGILTFVVTAGRLLLSAEVYAGVTIEGVEVGGRSRQELIQILNFWQQERNNGRLLLCLGDSVFKLDPQSIDLDIDVERTAAEAWNYGRQGSLLTRLKDVGRAWRQGYCLPLRVSYNEDKLTKVIEDWQAAVDCPARNASLSITGGPVPPEPGRKLASEMVRSIVLKTLKEPGVSILPLPVATVYPANTEDDITSAGIGEIWGSFTTSFNADNVNRVTNIKLAAAKINGRIVLPGDTFSFNDIVGPRERQFGFKEAMELVDGELVPGIGGGVCQVSSTLYNAALYANLAVIERYNHSKPLVYIPLGRDATVAFGALDFKFSNNTASPLMITAEVKDDKLLVGIFGRKKTREQVKLVTTDQQVIPPSVIKRTDSGLFLGETKLVRQGKPGYEVTTLRVVTSGDREIKREVLSRDRYSPEDTIVKIGSLMPPFARNSNAAD